MQDAKRKMQNGGCNSDGLQCLHFESCVLNRPISSCSASAARRPRSIRSAPTPPSGKKSPTTSGALVPTAVVFLTNRECPFRCVMCDLWMNTLDEAVPRGAIARQIRARSRAAAGAADQAVQRRQLLRPAGDPAGRLRGDRGGGRRLRSRDRRSASGVSRRRLCASAACAFALLGGRLEVAIGLETVHPEALARLNKRMTVDAFRRAAAFLRRHDIALRVFVLLNPPFVPAGRGRRVGVPVDRPRRRVRRHGVLGHSDARRQRRDGGAAATRSCPPRLPASRGGRRVRHCRRPSGPAACASSPTSGTSSGSSTARARPRARRGCAQMNREQRVAAR